MATPLFSGKRVSLKEIRSSSPGPINDPPSEILEKIEFP